MTTSRRIAPPFSLSSKTPLPRSPAQSLEVVPTSSPDEFHSSWDIPLERMDKMAEDSRLMGEARGVIIPPAILLAAGELRSVPLASSMYQREMGGSILSQRLLFGFKLAGVLSQKHTFPKSGKMIRKARKITKSPAKRFAEGAGESGFKNPHALWKEATTQQGKGWFPDALPLAPNDQHIDLRKRNIAISLPFGVQQAGNPRSCEGRRHSLKNIDCISETPINLATRYNLAEMYRPAQAAPGVGISRKLTKKSTI